MPPYIVKHCGMKLRVSFVTLRLIDTMRPICSSILCQLIFAILCEAYPASDPNVLNEMTGETFARFIKQYEKSNDLDNLKIDEQQRELLKALWNPKNTPEFFNDNLTAYRPIIGPLGDPIKNYGVSKRPASGKYHYYKCYFNPVTCYRK